MKAPEIIGFLGFGEAARAFVESLQATRPDLRFAAYDIKLDGREAAEMRAAMTQRGVDRLPDATMLCGADWIVSAVTADQSLVAVEPLLPALGPGNLLIDINSVSPDRKRETARLVAERGAAYADLAVMAPVHPRGHATPTLLAGAVAASLLPVLKDMGFMVKRAGDEPGAATAIKMVRSLFVKGLEAITTETLLAAKASGCFDQILASLADSYPGLGLPDAAAYMAERTLTHGARRAAEMRESAATLAALGLADGLASQIAAVQEAQGRAGPAPDTDDLAAFFATVLARRLAQR